MAQTSSHLLTSAALCLVSVILSPNFTQAHHLGYRLSYSTVDDTDRSGSIILRCRGETAEFLRITEVMFWLNRTTACDQDLRDRPDVQAIGYDDRSIMFNFTKNLDGRYSCGRRMLTSTPDNEITVEESIPVTLICKCS